MQRAQVWFVAIAVLIVGVGATYYNMQMKTDDLTKEIPTLRDNLKMIEPVLNVANMRPH